MNAAYVIGAAWLGAKLLSLLLEVLQTSLHDLRQTKFQMRLKAHPYARRLRRRPLISVIINAHNAEVTIGPCLDSVIKNNYLKRDVIVVNNSSTDNTAKSVRRFIKHHPRQNIKLVNKRKYLEAPGHLNVKTRGDLVMNLDARHTLEGAALKNAVRYFAMRDDISVLIPAMRVRQEKSLAGLLQQFDALRVSSAHAAGNAASPTYAIRRKNNHNGRQYYADDVMLTTEPLKSYYDLFGHSTQANIRDLQTTGPIHRSFSKMLVGAAALLEPFIVGYFLYVALVFDRPEAFGIAWVLGVLSLVFYVLSDRNPRLLQKPRLIGLAPAIYSLMVVLSLTRLAAVLRVSWQATLKQFQKDWQISIAAQATV